MLMEIFDGKDVEPLPIRAMKVKSFVSKCLCRSDTEVQNGSEKIFLRKGDKFTELMGSCIRTYGDSEVGIAMFIKAINEFELPPATELLRANSNVAANSLVRANIISKMKDFRIEDGCTVLGSIKAFGNLHIGKNTEVLGNVFCDKSVYIEMGVWIRGHVFAQENINIQNDCVCGQPKCIKTLFAGENLTLGRNCVIYGVVKAKGQGSVI